MGHDQDTGGRITSMSQVLVRAHSSLEHIGDDLRHMLAIVNDLAKREVGVSLFSADNSFAGMIALILRKVGEAREIQVGDGQIVLGRAVVMPAADLLAPLSVYWTAAGLG